MCLHGLPDPQAVAMRNGTGWPEDPGFGPAVVLLIGAPGVGKSTLAKALQAKHHSITLLNTGEQLRTMGLVDEQLAHPSEERSKELQQTARRLLTGACCTLKQR